MSAGTESGLPDDGAGLLVFNLFALEGFHVAEELRVPCAAVSPCLVPSAPAAGFERRFRAQHPRLYQRLKRSTPGGLPSRARIASTQCDSQRWQSTGGFRFAPVL